MDVDGMMRSYRMQQMSSEPAGGEEMSTIGHMGSGLPLLYLKGAGGRGFGTLKDGSAVNL
jgi:hypothetical protein